MIIAVQSPEYLPGFEYFSRIVKSDIHIFLDSVKMPKRDEVSRSLILGPNGPEWMTVPIVRSGLSGQSIAEARIDYSKNWQKKQLQQLYHLYSETPYFEDIYPVIKKVLKSRFMYIANLDIDLVNIICEKLQIDRKTFRSSELRIKGKSTELLMNIVKEFEGREILLPDYAREFTDEGLFKDNKIKVSFYSCDHPEYNQYRETFYPELSIFDIICYLGRKEVYRLLNN
ncbi:WbqC family protein [candidate division KSB1 bacterium]